MLSKEELHSIVCENIKKERVKRGLTQLELSERIDISHEYLRQMESRAGQKDFSFFTLYKITLVLGVSLDDIIKP